MKTARSVIAVLIIVALAALIGGCSDDRSTGPADGSAALVNLGDPGIQPASGEPVQFAARVMTTDCNQRMLTFYGTKDTVVAAHDCEIVRLQNPFDDVPVPFSDIQVGDSVQVCGFRYEYNYILAHRLRIFCESNCGCYDVAFRDTITAIDYAAETFTVANRTETITTDSNTVIWGKIIVNRLGGLDEQGHYGQPGSCLAKQYGNTNTHTVAMDTVYEFADLQVGDIVEVRAKTVDPETLLAVWVKIANCNYKKCVDFTAFLATIDAAERVVTFTDQDWIGQVCPNAALFGLDGTLISLDDFSVGDYVAVKGFPLESDTLRICKMEMLEYQ